MATSLPTTNGVHDSKTNGNGDGVSSFAVKAGLARMLKGGVIMDVVNAEQVCLGSFFIYPMPRICPEYNFSEVISSFQSRLTCPLPGSHC